MSFSPKNIGHRQHLDLDVCWQPVIDLKCSFGSHVRAFSDLPTKLGESQGPIFVDLGDLLIDFAKLGFLPD